MLAPVWSAVFQGLVYPMYESSVALRDRADILEQQTWACAAGGMSSPVPRSTAQHIAGHAQDAVARLPHEGVLTLVNSNFALEYPRALPAHVQLTGFLHPRVPAEPISPQLAAWLSESATPVVLVAFGSLAHSLQAEFVAMAHAMSGSQRFRFIWASREHPAHALDTMPCAGPGCILRTHWAPQAALLQSGQVAAFWSHGGMNSLSESIMATVPVICTGIFNDQPDNCVMVQDRRLGQALPRSKLQRREVGASALDDMLHRITMDAEVQAALRSVPAANAALGGVAAAMDGIEAAALLRDAWPNVAWPAQYTAPLWRVLHLDVALGWAALLVSVMWGLARGCRCAWRACASGTPHSSAHAKHE